MPRTARPKGEFRVAAFALLALAVACVPVQPPAATTPERADTIARSDPAPLPPSVPPMIYQLVSIGGTAHGTLRVSEPFVITTRVQAHRPVDSVDVTVHLPEVADANRTGWGPAFSRRGINVRYPALDSIVAPALPDRPIEMRSRLTIEAPGWYLVSMVARVRGDVTRWREPVGLESFHSFYLWIGPSSGSVAREVDLTRYPPTAASQSGPVIVLPESRGGQEMLDEGRENPRSFFRVGGTVRTRDGRAAAGVPVTARGYVERCPARAAAEERVVSDAQGRYDVLLRGWPAAPFTGCVSVLAEPTTAQRLRPGSATAAATFAAAPPERALQLDVIVDTITPDTLPWFPRVQSRARGSAAGQRVVVDSLRLDLDGDGSPDRVLLSADVERSARGELIWDDGHRWTLVIRTSQRDYVVLEDEFLPNGMVSLRSDRREFDPASAPPSFTVEERTPFTLRVRRVRWNAAQRAFEHESLITAPGPMAVHIAR